MSDRSRSNQLGRPSRSESLGLAATAGSGTRHAATSSAATPRSNRPPRPVRPRTATLGWMGAAISAAMHDDRVPARESGRDDSRVHGTCVPHGAPPHRTTVRCTTSPGRSLARTLPAEIHLPAPPGCLPRARGASSDAAATPQGTAVAPEATVPGIGERAERRKGPPWRLRPQSPVSDGAFGGDAGQRGLSRHHPGNRPGSQGPGTGTRGAWHHAESDDPPGHGSRPGNAASCAT